MLALSEVLDLGVCTVSLSILRISGVLTEVVVSCLVLDPMNVDIDGSLHVLLIGILPLLDTEHR